MLTSIICDWHFRRAVYALKHGKVISYPTEAVYGLGCDPFNRKAIADLLLMKHRRSTKGLLLIGARIEHFFPFCHDLETTFSNIIDQYWPGAVTILFPVKSDVSYLLTGGTEKIGLRLTEHPVAARLCYAFGGAIVSTSANVTRKKPIIKKIKIYQHFHDQLDYILPGELGGESKPSRIIDAVTGEIIRN